MTYEVFISHRHQDHQIAATLREGLRVLSRNRLRVHVCGEIQGGTNWRMWIRDKIASSEVMIFLYTDVGADWRWCLWELGQFHGKNQSGESPIICIKYEDIPPPSPLQDVQAYNANAAGIRAFFEDLTFKSDLFGERLNDELLLDSTRQLFETHVDRLVRLFIPRVKTQFFALRMGIRLSEVVGEEIMEIPLEEAPLSGNRDTMELLQLPETGATWGDLYNCLGEIGCSEWLQELDSSIDRIRRHQAIMRVMSTFRLPDGETIIPVISRIETFRVRRDREETVIPKEVFVIFIRMPQGLASPYSLEHMMEILNKWGAYPPSSVVRVKWKRRTDAFEYNDADLEEEAVVCAINPDFAKLFNFDFNRFPSPDSDQKLTAAKLLEMIKDYIAPEHFQMLCEDQATVNELIIFRNRTAHAEAPLQFNNQHPLYPNMAFLPYLICKHEIGDVSGPHETYLLVSYIKSFWPLDDPRSPYYKRSEVNL